MNTIRTTYKGAVPLFFIFILLSSFSFAITEYTQSGIDGINTYQLGQSLFDDNLASDTSVGKSLTSPRYYPFVADLDNDGTKEIIIVDGSELVIYHYNSTTGLIGVQDGYEMNNGTGLNTSAPYIYDLDGDGDLEILLNQYQHGTYGANFGQQLIRVFDWNGTLSLDKAHDWGVNSSLQGERVNILEIACIGLSGDCMAYSYSASSFGNNGFKSVAYFNYTTATKNRRTSIGASDLRHQNCPSLYGSLAVEDFDNDGITEIVQVLGDIRLRDEPTIQNFNINIDVYSKNISGGMFNLDSTENFYIANVGSDSTFLVSGITGCFAGLGQSGFYLGNMLSNPVIFDGDGKPSNGKELYVALVTGYNEVKIYSFKHDGSGGYEFLDDHPEILAVDGSYPSNLILTSAFEDPAKNEVCTMVSNNMTANHGLLCASDTTSMSFGFFLGAESITYNYSSSFNLSPEFPGEVLKNLIHSQQIVTTNTFREIVSPFGTLGIPDSPSLTSANSLQTLWTQKRGHVGLIGVDYENEANEDFIGLSDSTLWYYDDNFKNTNCDAQDCIAYEINPCIEQTWLQNETIQVVLTLQDINNDALQGRAILYKNHTGTAQQDSGWSINISSGGTAIFTFNANETVSNGVLSLQARDSDDISKVQEEQLIFSVSSTEGVVFNECTTSKGFDVPDVPIVIENATITESADTNLIDTGVGLFMSVTGLSGTLSFFLFIVIASLIGLWWGLHSSLDKNYIQAIILGLDLVLVVIGVKLGYFGVGSIAIITLISVLAGAIMLRRGATN